MYAARQCAPWHTPDAAIQTALQSRLFQSGFNTATYEGAGRTKGNEERDTMRLPHLDRHVPIDGMLPRDDVWEVFAQCLTLETRAVADTPTDQPRTNAHLNMMETRRT